MKNSATKKVKLSTIIFSSILLSSVLMFTLGSTFDEPTMQLGEAYDSEIVDCNRYFNDNEYTSLYEITSSLGNNDSKIIKTWGTVSDIHLLRDGTKRAYIQSTDRNGNKGAVALINFGDDLSLGNVITVNGTVTRNYGMPTLNISNYTIDYLENSSPIVPYELGSVDFGDGLANNEPAFTKFYEQGTIYSTIKNVKLIYDASASINKNSEHTVKFANGDTLTLYVNSSSAATILNKLANLNGKQVDIYGPIQSFVNGSGQNQFLEILIGEDSQIVETTLADYPITAIRASKTSVNLAQGGTSIIEINLFPQNSLLSSYSFEVADESIVTCSKNSDGSLLLTALSIGETSVNVFASADANISLSLLIEVGEGVPASLTFSSNDTPYGELGYDTGNYFTYSYDGNSFGFYRAVSKSGDFISLLGENQINNLLEYSLAGAFYNEAAFGKILSIEIEYFSESSGDWPTVSFGVNHEMTYVHQLPYVSSYSEETIDVSDYAFNYFIIETGGSDLSIKSLTINYLLNSGASADFATLDGLSYRLEPVVYTGNLIPGQSSVDVPIDVTYYSDGTYTVNEYVTLTYDTYDAAIANSRIENLYVDIALVSAYFTAFKTYPANYVSKDDYYEAYQYFGDLTRSVSAYTRTDGYALSVPWNPYENGQPLYYELDVAISDSYSGSNRGVGRLVAWVAGFEGYGDSYPVVTYTDDHYATFKEYYNDGCFSANFNAEMTRSAYNYGYPLIVH